MLEYQDCRQRDKAEQQVWNVAKVRRVRAAAKKVDAEGIRLRPIAMTTVPVTIGGKNLRSGLMTKPRPISKAPPMIQAPMIAP